MKINDYKVCKYRNCNKTIEGRPNKLYCNRRCKSNESIYILREKEKRDLQIINI